MRQSQKGWGWEEKKTKQNKKNSLEKTNVYFLSSVQLLSCVQLFATPWIAACQASLSITNPRSLLTHVHWVSDAIQPSHPVISFSSCLQSFPASGILQESAHQVAKLWSFRFSISPSSEYSGLIFFRMDWLDLLAVQGTLKSSPAQLKSIHSLHSAFFIVQLSHPHDYWTNHSFD